MTDKLIIVFAAATNIAITNCTNILIKLKSYSGKKLLLTACMLSAALAFLCNSIYLPLIQEGKVLTLYRT
jgi:hypothetical protein